MSMYVIIRRLSWPVSR